ncbi:peptidoglycan-binding domain-containing protein [Mariprofundus micogutta]|nr:peptidoglycan-binding domain-containing protein [Mariprofundus micogutta]
MNKRNPGKKLKIFMRGKSVSTLQTQLTQRGFSITDIKGVFGPSTRDAVKSLQTQFSLQPTGIVDDAFRQAVGQQQADVSTQTESIKRSSHSDSDKKLDNLIQLLLRKGIIEQRELDSLLNNNPDDELPAKPLFL